MTTRPNTTSCWVIHLDRQEGTPDTSPAPSLVAATEETARALLEQTLTETPDRGNLLEDYPFHTTTTDPTTVHLVVYSDEDGPTVSAVFDTLTDATTHAQELRAHGEDDVTITDVPFTTTL